MTIRNSEVPPEFLCAITKKLLKDPVKSPYGHVYEREVIEKWITNYGSRCPVTGEPLALGQLVADDALRFEIDAWNAPESPKSKQPEAAEVKETSIEAKVTPEAKEDDLYDF